MPDSRPIAPAIQTSARAGRDVFIALALKGVLLLALYLLCFSPAHRPAADAQAIATALLGAPPDREAR